MFLPRCARLTARFPVAVGLVSRAIRLVASANIFVDWGIGMLKLLGSRAGIAIASAVATATLVGGIAYAVTTPTATPNTFYACALSGYIIPLAITVNTPPKCPKGQTVVSWNQSGAVGGTGLAGKDGKDGAVGGTGPQGIQGLPGGTGPAGKDGVAGAVGGTGLQGIPGAVGGTGPAGQDGAVGGTGPQGIPGAVGGTGPAGPGLSGIGTNSGQAGPGAGAECTLGEVLLTASRVANGTPADGRLLLITQNVALFQLLGTTYGGDGITTFALPDLRSVAPDNTTYSICTSGIFPAAR
jgi:hypothetical protein